MDSYNLSLGCCSFLTKAIINVWVKLWTFKLHSTLRTEKINKNTSDSLAWPGLCQRLVVDHFFSWRGLGDSSYVTFIWASSYILVNWVRLNKENKNVIHYYATFQTSENPKTEINAVDCTASAALKWRVNVEWNIMPNEAFNFFFSKPHTSKLTWELEW